nr:Toll/interleukin-1 receptor (TIR) domain-containing protein [Tanacetum cinerariifolium]
MINDQLLKSIEESRFFIIVFSKTYASSSWCLQELVKIMECQKMDAQSAYPVFFDVEPTEVRKQSGPVGEAFSKHENHEAAGKWRDAMKELADLAGWELKATACGEVSKPSLSGLKELQKRILEDVLNKKDITFSSVHDGKNILKAMMHRRKILVVLDDVDCIEQLEALAGGLDDWLKSGSRIIITTRDEQVLKAHIVKFIHDLNLLSSREAICLFSRYAFQKEIPIRGYEELARQVVHDLKFVSKSNRYGRIVVKGLGKIKIPKLKILKNLKFLSLSHLDLTIFDFGITPNLETTSCFYCMSKSQIPQPSWIKVEEP